MLGFLIAMFALQTYLVYSDDTGRSPAPLSDAGLAGRTVWLKNNCQVCHQFYGFGGFLGPDLTNAAGRLDRARLEEVLTDGIGQMPVFHLSSDEIDGVQAYLSEMNETGIGQAKAPQVQLDGFRTAVAALVPADQRAGADGFLNGACIACHAPLAPRRIGPYLAPDLSVIEHLSASGLDEILRAGRPERGMPPTGLSDDVRTDIAGFLRWLGQNREAVRRAAGDEDDRGLPWWEFR